jgi:Effector-associated domain 2/Caspase domain
MSNSTPADTLAIAVGIERYEAGPTWNLDGPASDALRFLQYLQRRGVPKANTRAYLAPLQENTVLRDRAEQLVAEVCAPTEAVLNDLIERTLPRLRAGLLLFFWAGHGLITLNDERRLYTADATKTAKRNVDLNSLLAALRSETYPNLDRQALIIDTCANYIPNPTASLMHKTYAEGAGVAGREQFVLCAASPGEYAKNLNVEKSGLLSRELNAILEAQEAAGVWPPDLANASEQLAATFVSLRQQGKTRQTPATFWFRSPTRGGQFLGQMDVSVSAPNAEMLRALSVSEYTVLLDAFLRLDTMKTRENRDRVVRHLRPQIGNNVERHAAARQDTIAILDTSRYYNGLAELLRSINVSELDSPAMQALVSLAHRILPNEVPEILD